MKAFFTHWSSWRWGIQIEWGGICISLGKIDIGLIIDKRK